MSARRTQLDPAEREALRARLVGAIPGWYRPGLHLASTLGTGLALLALAAVGLTRVVPGLVPRDLLVVPLVVVVANAFEWWAHKHLLHRRRRGPLAVLYDRHTPEHHMVYVDGDMVMRSFREARLVLIPAVGVVGAVLASLPVGALLAELVSPAAGLLGVTTAGLYMVTYEATHLAYHLPADHPIGRLRVVARLREHHALHHDPGRMQRANFNVTLPLFDLLLGTLERRR